MTQLNIYSKSQTDDKLSAKQDTLVSSGEKQNIRTINGTSLLGTGDIKVDGSLYISEIAPSTATVGMLWYEPTQSRIYVCTHVTPSGNTWALLFDESGSVEVSRWGDITGDINQQLDLIAKLAEKQATLTPGQNITIEENVISAIFNGYTKEEADVLLGNKQDKLTAGENITIENNVISASSVDAYTKAETDALLDTKQGVLTAGKNITIDENNVISASGGGTTEYTGIAPIQVNNTQYTIGIDQSGIQGKLTAGENITIDANNVISASGGGTEYTGVAPIIVNNSTHRISLDESDIQGKLTAGENITIDANNVISATGTGSYSAGDGIEISNNEISAKIGDGLQFDSSGAIEVVGGSTDGVKTINSIEPSSEGNIQLAGAINPQNSLPFITITNGGTGGTNFALPMFEVQECIFTVDADTNTSTGTVTFGRTYLRPPLLFFMCIDSASRDYGVHVKSVTTTGAVLHSASNFSTTGGSTIYCLIVPRE